MYETDAVNGFIMPRTNSVNNPEREIISAAKSRTAFLLIRPWQRAAARLHQLLQGHLKNASLVG